MNDYYIYITTNKINGKKYIGQHKGSPTGNYFGSGTAIIKAIAKYGKKNFSKEILCYCQTRAEANQKEKFYIKLYNAVESDQFYNNAEGGSGGDGWRAWHRWALAHPEEAQQIYKQSGKKLQNWRKEHPEEYKEKTLKPFLQASQMWREENPDKVKEIMIKVNKAKIKWQQEHPEEYKKQVERWRESGSITNSQKVLCITTGEIFNSLSEAGRVYNVPQGNISKCLQGERKSAGKHPITKKSFYGKKSRNKIKSLDKSS